MRWGTICSFQTDNGVVPVGPDLPRARVRCSIERMDGRDYPSNLRHGPEERSVIPSLPRPRLLQQRHHELALVLLRIRQRGLEREVDGIDVGLVLEHEADHAILAEEG